MGLRINQVVPDFTADTSEGQISFHDWIGDSWAILFSHPKDFTPVCTTEFGAVAQLAPEWDRRGVKVIGISVDDADSHRKWKGDIATFASAEPTFPIIADEDLAISKAYDMLPEDAYLPDGRTPNDTATVRSVYIIGPDKQLKLSMTYPMNVGRNFAEILRAVDALQMAGKHGVAAPANWEHGRDVVIPATVSDEDAKAKFGAFTTHFPYLRTTADPS
ncbi:peroxiredoxin [Jannaschia sp. 2305UL9-9]|uniref:peroxiredoxin n=1 Tax=Jannaschia sp. 2305UL9-9 TaxID=3121638 RepID=UPI003528AC6E